MTTPRLTKLLRILRSKDRFLGTAWCLSNSRSFEEWAAATDPALWRETVVKAEEINRDARQAIAGLPIAGGRPGVVGGGGCDVRKLYFLARLRKPRVIVETGVSAGYSSRAFLEAIQDNGMGRLFSSDLPTLLPKERVGTVVPAHLRQHWELYYDGDRANIPSILQKVAKVDFLHYDSEKSYEAKAHIVGIVKAKMGGHGTIVIDDIDRDLFFRDYSKEQPGHCSVYRHVGVIEFSQA